MLARIQHSLIFSTLMPHSSPNTAHTRQTGSPNFSFRFGARSKSGKVKPKRQHGAMVAIGDDGGRVVTVVAQEWNWDRV